MAAGHTRQCSPERCGTPYRGNRRHLPNCACDLAYGRTDCRWILAAGRMDRTASGQRRGVVVWSLEAVFAVRNRELRDFRERICVKRGLGPILVTCDIPTELAAARRAPSPYFSSKILLGAGSCRCPSALCHRGVADEAPAKPKVQSIPLHDQRRPNLSPISVARSSGIALSGSPGGHSTGPGYRRFAVGIAAAGTTARLMQVVAHPDDEDGGMLTLEARGHGVNTLLMTLNRGEGGQNKSAAICRMCWAYCERKNYWLRISITVCRTDSREWPILDFRKTRRRDLCQVGRPRCAL